MSVLSIRNYPDPVLRQSAKPVTVFDNTLRTLANDLTETLHGTSGIGLCAPQVGHSVQLLVMDLSDDHSNPQLFINPRILSKAGMAIAEERCLSLPGMAARIIRSGVVQVSAQDVNGRTFECQLEGMHAVCLQHELDHLQGILFIDRLSKLRRFRLRHALHDLESREAPAVMQTA